MFDISNKIKESKTSGLRCWFEPHPKFTIKNKFKLNIQIKQTELKLNSF